MGEAAEEGGEVGEGRIRISNTTRVLYSLFHAMEFSKVTVLSPNGPSSDVTKKSYPRSVYVTRKTRIPIHMT